MIANDPNIAKVELIAKALGPLRERLVLVGGCAAGLLFTDPAAAPARVTYDVDLLATPAFHDGLQGYIVSGSPQGGQVVNVTQRLTRLANIDESKK